MKVYMTFCRFDDIPETLQEATERWGTLFTVTWKCIAADIYQVFVEVKV